MDIATKDQQKNGVWNRAKPRKCRWILLGSFVVLAILIFVGVDTGIISSNKGLLSEVYLFSDGDGYLYVSDLSNNDTDVWRVEFEIGGNRRLTIRSEELMEKPTNVKIIYTNFKDEAITEVKVPGLMVIDTSVQEKIEWDNYIGAKTLLVYDPSGYIKLADLRDLHRAKTLYLQECNSINNLDNIKYMSLESLFISNMYLEDIDGLNTCKLNMLMFESVKGFQNIDAIKDLSSLTTLHISNSDIGDIDVIKSLSNLKRLDLLYCQEVRDFNAIKDLKSLESLTLDSLNIKDLIFLKGTTSLKFLELGTLDIKDINCLSYISSLESCILYNLDIKDLESLVDLPKLELLVIIYSRIENYKAIGYMNNLSELSLVGLNIEDLDVLKSLSNLQKLWLWSLYDIEDLDVIEELDSLEQLTLWSIDPEIISDLRNPLPKLNSLLLGNIAVEDISFIEDFEALKFLFLNVETNNLESLDSLNKLKAITFEDMKLINIESLLKSHNIKRIYLHNVKYSKEANDVLFELKDKGVKIYRDDFSVHDRFLDKYIMI